MLPAGTGGAAGAGDAAGASPVSIHWTSAEGSVAWPSRGSRCTDSSRSLPKRTTDTVKAEISTPWRRESQALVVSARGVVGAGDEHELRRVARHRGLERLVDAGQLRRVHRRDGGGRLQRADQLPLHGLARHLHDDGAAGLLVEREHVDARHRLGRQQAQRRQAKLVDEGLPGGAHQRQQLLAIGRGLGDQAGGLRSHQRLGRLVDAQHFVLQWIGRDPYRPL